MTNYFGPIKTKAQADRLASILEKKWDKESRDCAKMLRDDWHKIASRPQLAFNAICLSESTHLGRPGGIMDIIINGRK
jgi:hypothetical protein